MIILSQLRLKHYIKNLLIFFPIIYASKLLEIDLIIQTIVTFISFSFVTSIVYMLNDIFDLKLDRLHPIKKKRPLASGLITIRQITYLISLLAIVIFFINVFLLRNASLMIIQLIYLLLNISYSLKLKNIPVLELFIVSSGFLIRIFLGGIVANAYVSEWLYLTILSMALFISIGKRRNELQINTSSRLVLKKYTLSYLNEFMYIFLTATIVFYSLWTIFNESIVYNQYTIWTVPLVIIIIMQYTFNIEVKKISDPTEIFYNDKLLMILSIIYSLSIFFIVYYNQILDYLI